MTRSVDATPARHERREQARADDRDRQTECRTGGREHDAFDAARRERGVRASHLTLHERRAPRRGPVAFASCRLATFAHVRSSSIVTPASKQHDDRSRVADDVVAEPADARLEAGEVERGAGVRTGKLLADRANGLGQVAHGLRRA